MHKGIKILGKVFAAIVLSLLFIPVLLSLLLSISPVQNFIVDKAAQIVSRKLETTVSIGRIDIGLFNKVKVYDFYVEDYQRDTLLYAGRVDALLTGLGLFGGGLTLGRAEVDDAKLYLRQTPSGELNIKEVIAHLNSKDKPKKGNFKLTITSVEVRNLDFCLERLDRKDPPFGIDFSHMHLLGIDAHANNLTIDGLTIYTVVNSLSCRERSGFVLDEMSGEFYLTEGCLGFDELRIRTPYSDLNLPHVAIVGNSWEEYKDFLGQVEINASLRGTRLSTEDIAYFAPMLRPWGLTFSDLNLEVQGKVDDFVLSMPDLTIESSTSLALHATVTGLPDIKKTRFDLDLQHLITTAPDVEHLAQAIAGQKLSAKVMNFIRNGRNLTLSGRFTGLLSSFRAQAILGTGVGRAECDLWVSPRSGGRRAVRGGVSTQNFRLGELLGVDRIGAATLTARVDGVLGSGFADAKVEGAVSMFEFNGYTYDSIRLDGRLYNKEFDGRITSRDPNLNFDFMGLVNLNDSVPRYDFSLDLRRANLVRMHINRRDSVSQLAMQVSARGAGRSFDDLNGEIRITDVDYCYNDICLKVKQMTLRGENSAESKLIELRSDFADATFRSRASYREVLEYLKMSAWKYLPILYDRDKYVNHTAQQTNAVNDYSLLSVQIKQVNPLVDAVAQGLQIADGSELQLLFNPAGDKISLRVNSDYVERKRMLATKININASNKGDSLVFYAASEDFYLGTLHLRELSLTGGAREGVLQLNTGFNDSLKNTSGLLGLRAWLAAVPGPDGRVLNVRILPSHLRRGNMVWQVLARRIEIDTARVVVDRFYIRNKQQELLINGVASRSRNDSVTVNLRNFDMAPFSQAVDRMGYGIEGVSNGNATIKSVLYRSEITADIRFDSLRVNNLAAPSLQLVSKWDFERNRAGFTVANRLRRDTLVQGFYAPAQGRYYARMKVDSLRMGLLDPLLRGVISDTRGVAKVDLMLTGQGREADLRGALRVDSLSTCVDFTQVTYSAPEVVFEVQNNRLLARNVTLFDPEGNRGGLDFELNLQHLSNIAYSVRVTPHEMLVLNTTLRDNDLFYGKVHASGIASITGDKRGVNMDITATTDNHSSFFLPLSGKSNISSASFVTFAVADKADTTDYLVRKKQLFEQRRKQSKSPSESTMNIALTLNVRPNLNFQMDLGPSVGVIKARGEGALNLDINPKKGLFQMFGDYTISEGEYLFSLQNIVNRKFIIENGSTIQWTGSPMNAMLNIEAIYKLKASLTPLLQGTTSGVSGERSVPVECVIQMRDRLTAPTLRFDVKVPSADSETQTIIANALNTPETIETQFFFLVTSNSFMSEATGVESGLGTSVSATGMAFLSNMVSRLVSTDGYNVLIDYRPKSEMTGDEIDFGLSKSLVNDRLFIEVEGNYLIDNSQAVNRNLSNFMGEAYITWLIDRAGTLKLKGFTQTIDRFDENQGLQETGIGIYYKEDFNNLKDLRERVRDRFSSKKRRARRAARIETAAADSARIATDSARVATGMDSAFWMGFDAANTVDTKKNRDKR